MLSSDTQLKKLCHEFQRQANGQIALDSWTPTDSWRRTVTASSLIKGNFKDPNPWSYTVRTRVGLTGSIRRVVLDNPSNKTELLKEGQVDFNWFISELSTAADETATYNGAVERLNDKIRGKLDLATSLAETGQTVKMLNLVDRFKAGVVDMQRSFVREIFRKSRELRKGRALEKALRRWQRGLASRHPGAYRPVPVNPGLVNRSSSLAANGWCEYTYGWSPLISDIRNVAENIVGFVRNKDAIRVSCTKRLDAKETVSISSYGVNMPCEIVTVGFVKTIIGVKLRPGWDDNLAKWTSLNPLSVTWELIPYSFVVDWFLDIGSYIRGLETALLYGNFFQSGYRSTLVKYDRKLTGIGAKKVGIESQVWSVNSGLSKTTFGRSILQSYPSPYLPSFQVDLGSARLLSAAALLRQLLK